MEQAESTPVTNRFKIGIVGCGQGGSTWAQTFMKAIDGDLNHLCSINLSPQDLEAASLVPAANRILLDKNGFGAGGNRSVSKRYAVQLKDALAQSLSEKLMGVNLILVPFSTAGGTGSGVGPFLSALLESDSFKKTPGKAVPVFGVALLPDSREGELKQSNTIEALKEISTFAKNKVARFLLVDNDSKSEVADDVERWKQINAGSIDLIKRYLFKMYTSQSSNLDYEDRYTSLCIPGCHSFCTYNPASLEISTSFVLPDGALVKRMASEIPENTGESRKRIASAVGATVDEMNMVGYYAPDEEGAYPIVHFAGFSNLNKITERYQSWFTQIKQISQRQQKIDAEKGVGFASIEENKSYLDSQSNTDTSKSSDDLVAMLG